MSEKLTPVEIAILDIGKTAEAIVKIDDRVVIDARQKIDQGRARPWVNPSESKKYSDIFEKIREAHTKGGDMNTAFLKAMQELGFKVNDVKIIGDMPDHWNRKP